MGRDEDGGEIGKGGHMMAARGFEAEGQDRVG